MDIAKNAGSNQAVLPQGIRCRSSGNDIHCLSGMNEAAGKAEADGAATVNEVVHCRIFLPLCISKKAT
jgi:hypothetical protein